MSEAATLPAIGFSLNVDVPGGRALVFQSHVPQNYSAAQINTQLDKLLLVSDRAVARYTLPLLKAQLDAETAQYERCLADFQRVQDAETDAQEAWAKGGRRGPYKPATNNSAQQLANAKATVEALNKKLDKIKAEIAECEGKIKAGVD